MKIDRYQAEQLPDVVRADIETDAMTKRQTQYMPVIPDVPICPEEYLPADDWQRDIIASFSELRTVIPYNL